MTVALRRDLETGYPVERIFGTEIDYQAQGRTEKRVEELAEAQSATEKEIRVLAKGLKETRGDLGGLSRSVSYGFENEAYKMLPKLLKTRYNIELKDRLIRAEVGSKEINIIILGVIGDERVISKGKNVPD